MEIMYIKKISNNYFSNKPFVGFRGELGDLNEVETTLELPKLNQYFKIGISLRKGKDFLKALGLDEKLLRAKPSDLSAVELKLITLIRAILLKPETIVLNNFEYGINDRMLNRVVRFLKTIHGAFNIKFIIISKNPLFLSKLVKDIIVMNEGIIKYQGQPEIALKQYLFPEPEIHKFISLANSKGAGLEYTLEEKELLKSIYRSLN